MALQPVIKWTGSKRYQAEEIISKIPDKNYSKSTYYEPFVGGGAVLYKLLNSNIKFENYVCSDICKPLIDLYSLIKFNPQYLYTHYRLTWERLQKEGQNVFYDTRKAFNETQLPEYLLFLSRTCANGLIRFNSKGEFNTSFHINRPGINSATMRGILLDWSEKLNQYNVDFVCTDYINIKPNKDDFMYMDPPYFNTKGMYYGTIDEKTLWNYLKQLKCSYLISLDGQSGTMDNTCEVPADLYDKHLYISSGGSSFKRMVKHEIAEVKDSLYIKNN